MSIIGKRIKILNSDFTDIAIEGILPTPTLIASLSSSSINVGETSTLTISSNSDGEVTVIGDSNFVTITGTGNTRTITGIAGSPLGVPVTLTINQAATQSYTSASTTVIITVTGAAPEYTITSNVANGTYTGDTTITQHATASVTISANSDYLLPSSIAVLGATYTYDMSTGIISLSNPTGNVTITATCIDLDTIALKNKSYRDIFITAPTGAGKSMIFQLPSIYLAQKYKNNENNRTSRSRETFVYQGSEIAAGKSFHLGIWLAFSNLL